MIKFLQKTIPLLFLLSLFFVIAQPAMAGISEAFKNNRLTGFAGNVGYDTASSSSRSVEGVVSLAIQTVFGLLGVVFMIYIFYGGALWMTASGSEEKIKEAQTILKRAIIGLIITLLSYSITYFVIDILLI